jgi:hypothetical protein
MNKKIFRIVCNYEYYWNENYTTEDYIDLLSTYSDHIALDAEKRECLFDKLRKMINTKYNGIVHKEYVTELEIGKTIE